MYDVTETEMLAKLYRPAVGEDEGSFANFTAAARALVPATVVRVLHPDPAAINVPPADDLPADLPADQATAARPTKLRRLCNTF